MSRKDTWQRQARRVTQAAQNALELIQVGRLSEPYSASYDVLHKDYRYTLRRYQGIRAAQDSTSSPVLLVPPLMLSAEIYDISAELSAAATLVREGIDVWVTDFRAPEEEDGGLTRTLDDHVLAVSDAIDRISDMTRRDVHLAGYSQGGMFAYQCAAYRRNRGIASVITFGSPVDIHRSVPNFSDAFAERLTSTMRTLLGGPLNRVEGLSGRLTSLGFKMMGMRKEFGQVSEFLGKLHDRQALEKREAKRLFLRGDGFVAWPGPAFRTFVDEFIVANRMATGGFVIDGKTATLADITCPILCFVGERDEMASPDAVRAIHNAAPRSEVFEIPVLAGHFGLVVGSKSLQRTWPAVAQWVRWRDKQGPIPAALAAETQRDPDDYESMEDDLDFDLAFDVVTKLLRATWHRLQDGAENLSDSADHLRYQIPRIRMLKNMHPGTSVSFSALLAKQAQTIPERTFFLWQGRAFNFADSNQRVDNVVRGLIACDVSPTQRIGVLMRGRPSYLTLIAALNRIGAVAVLIDPRSSDAVFDDAIVKAEVAILIADPESAPRACERFDGQVLVLGGGAGETRSLESTSRPVIDMEAIDPQAVKLPPWYTANPGRARDLAMIIISSGPGGRARIMRVSNARWAFSAYGAAAAATLRPHDTVYCCLPLHHAAGTMVAVGSALVGGSRLALATGFSPRRFWSETRRYGATVVFYAGEMCRSLVDAPHTRSENRHPIRLFAGSGMRRDVWERLTERFGPVGILEFYATTETNTVLANASGLKPGSVGSPLPGSNPVALVRFDLQKAELVRGIGGYCVPSLPGELGMMITQITDVKSDAVRESRVLRDVFTTGDTWYSTRNLLHMDVDGDFWFVDRIDDLVPSDGGHLLCVPVEDVLYAMRDVALAAVYGETEGQQTRLVAAIVLHRDGTLEAEHLSTTLAVLDEPQRPSAVRVFAKLPMSDGFRPLKSRLRAGEWTDVISEFRYDKALGSYRQVQGDASVQVPAGAPLVEQDLLPEFVADREAP